LVLALLLAVVATVVLAQEKKSGGGILTFTPPEPSSPVPGELLRKIAVEIELECKVNGRSLSFTGSGFIVAVPAPPAEKHLNFQYLVTNRHVAECWDEPNHPLEVVSTDFRVNTQNGGSMRFPVIGVKDDGKPNWFFPTDESVDLAVTPVRPLADLKLDYMMIDFDSFATRDTFRQHRIGEGSTVIFAGTFVQFPGDRRFQPILRQGTLSMIPDEPITTTTSRLGTLYLADVHVFGGNSGSPVFAKPQDDIVHMGDQWFIGLVSGYYIEKADSKMEIAVTVKGETEANSGVAMIVPADEVKKLIENNPTLKGYRDAYLSTLKNQTPSLPHK
jgi:hypothetical protein